MVLRLFALWRRRERNDGDGIKDLDRVVDARDGENGQVRMHCQTLTMLESPCQMPLISDVNLSHMN